MEVVSAAHGAFGPLLEKLTALLVDEYARLKGVRREIRSLRSELSSMHAALKEYTKLEDPNDQVKTWISLVRELAYDTEDALDKFVHQQQWKWKAPRWFQEVLHKTVSHLKTLGSRRGIADQIDDLKDRIKQVKELKDSYTIDGSRSSATRHGVMDPRLHAIFAEEAHLVGMEGPRDDLANWMVEEGNNSSKHCKVLSIVGFGGLGKTTLANEVRRKIQGQFHCHAFVSVSQKPDIKKIINDVISQVSCVHGSTKDSMDWDENKSIAKLREMLQDKRYLIIIDDVWSRQSWDTIKCAFPDNNCSSRIIATTRIIDVAKSCCLNTDDRIWDGAYVALTKGSMRNLEEFLLSFDVSVAKAYGFYLGIEHIPSLKLIQAVLRNEGATHLESKTAAAAIRKEAGAHPNHPEVCILEEPDEDEDDNEKTDFSKRNEKTDNDEDIIKQ
ncbi:hypothetical protein ZWY2020_054956 [Hordeum vulgare]|nr:hypothetical protein ZWY2020_054956 [Hordeum vulgare]